MTGRSVQTRPAAEPTTTNGTSGGSPGPPPPVRTRSPVESLSVAGTVTLAGRVATILTVGCGVIAVVVHTWFAASARRWLAFPFAGIPARPSEAASIFLHNLRALAAICGLLLIAQAAHWTPARAGAGTGQRMLRSLGEALLGAGIAANLIVIGAALGAYGTRMVVAALPHGPLELASYSLALSLYREGRTRALAARLALAILALSAALLALAAILETYVNPWA
jgi:hypothetical protein